MGTDADGNWDGTCACGKKEKDGVMCRLGATHRGLPAATLLPWLQTPATEAKSLPWETAPSPSDGQMLTFPWSTPNT